jgi:glycerol-3-phosphate dehydrogenase
MATNFAIRTLDGLSGAMQQVYDLVIIGGGINGCGIARDAAGRGWSVFLCEMDDLGSGTSSRSTKLIHGGLRYLEHFDFHLVRESLAEREVLWRIAPHIVRPMRFVLPHGEGARPAWMLRVGLFLYDHLGGRERLPGTRVLDLREDPAGQPLEPGTFTTGFEYSDCWADDARLVVLNARDAADRGAVVRTRTRAVAAERSGDAWHIAIEDAGGGQATVAARALVNAAGPWVEEVRARLDGASQGHVRLVEGTHIVVPRLFDHDRAYLLQNPDGRVVFAIPYEGDFTLIGTTDRDYRGDPAATQATAEEIAYLCAAANAAFARRVEPGDVVWTYSGVRPLFDDGASDAKSASRDYVLELDDAGEGSPLLLSIIGGKITTYRRLAEAALERLAPHLPPRAGQAAGWTATQALPGGDFEAGQEATLATRLARSFPFLGAGHSLRLARAYGTRAWTLLGKARSMSDLGRQFGATLTETEVRYLAEYEWARTAEDVLWRRTKLGLRLAAAETAALDDWMRQQAATSAEEPAG